MYSNFFCDHEVNGLKFLTSGNIKARHIFTTRLGGVSEGHLAALNLGRGNGDKPENIIENYARISAASGIDTSRMAYTNQVHGDVVLTVAAGDARSCLEPVSYECDGIVTNERNLPLVCFAADCIPVLLCDVDNGVIAAVHCGWRSSVSDILKNAVSCMCGTGAKPRSICAAIGPAIGSCCFEVGGEVIEACEAYIGQIGGLARKKADGKWLLDLKSANAKRLVQLGLLPENISVSSDCTMCIPGKYFSHRYSKGVRGLQGAIIAL